MGSSVQRQSETQISIGSVLLRYKFRAEGGVDLTGTRVGKTLSFSEGKFVGKVETPAIKANSVKIGDHVFFRRGVFVDGEVRFAYAEVTGNFQWRNVESPEKAVLNLEFTKVGILLNDSDSWPAPGNLRVGGFVFNQIDHRASSNAEAQLDWLGRQPQDKFLSQPYEHLAAVFNNMGLEEDARKAMIAKNEDHASHLHRRPAWLWYGFFGKLIGYGYRPWRAFCLSVALIVIGCLLFNGGYISKIVTPTEKEAYAVYVDKNGKGDHFERYPVFNAFIYSVETFVPLLKLGINDRWTPNANVGVPVNLGVAVLTTGSLLRGYLWFHMISGWVLTTLWVGGITGLVKT
jgi:hypothetical protein